MRPAAWRGGSVGTVDALLSFQEVGDALDSNGKARQRAEDILDQLDELRHGLLMGTISRRQLESLPRSCARGATVLAILSWLKFSTRLSCAPRLNSPSMPPWIDPPAATQFCLFY